VAVGYGQVHGGEPPGALAGIYDALAVGKFVRWHAEQECTPAGRDPVIVVFAMTCRNWEHFGCYSVAPPLVALLSGNAVIRWL
jgi:hypothetical protein